jgi:SAM-dependent methyltransferase
VLGAAGLLVFDSDTPTPRVARKSLSWPCVPPDDADRDPRRPQEHLDPGAMTVEDSKDLVRRGYDTLVDRYRADDADDGIYVPWLAALQDRTPPSGAVLDLGCGIPVARSLAQAGYQVTGVDFSQVQLQRARRLVPAATFLRADATKVAFPTAVFDAVVCLYVLIHLPLADQPVLLRHVGRWLRPGGWLLATGTVHGPWTGTEDHWLGGPEPMWWSHADAATYRAWIQAAGLNVTAQEVIPEEEGGHILFWARRALPPR